jgi:CubicO group peptidase (beta-lactamase class C family)
MTFKNLDSFLRLCVHTKKIPGCVCLIAKAKNIQFFNAYGHRQLIPRKFRINKDTIFDLASVTKPIVTAVSIMLLYEEKLIKLTDKTEKYLNGFRGKPNGKKTIKQLLIHTSGMPAWFPVYILPKDRRMGFLASTNTWEKSVIYSCLGYIVLGKILETVTGSRLDRFCHKHLFKRLGLKHTFIGRTGTKKNFAATEFGNEHEKILSSRYGDNSGVNWRNYMLKGEVNDGNCFYGFNSISGNAGLFSNAKELMKIMQHYVAGSIVKPQTMKMMIKDYTGGTQKRGLGWVIDPYPKICSPTTFSHTGFTGTMCLVEPRSNYTIILLANAIHPKVRVGLMKPIRRKVVQIVAKIMKRL